MQILPPDCVLLPIQAGKLLVSPGLATYCGIRGVDLLHVEQALAFRQGEISSVSLEARLAAHGFFGAPRPPKPSSHTVQFQLTNACNLACSYCCTNSGAARQSELTPEQWRRAADEVRAEMGPGTRLSILGGEPFLLPWAIDIAEYVQGSGLELAIFSNGLALSESSLSRRVARLIMNGAEVRVSLAGPSRESCDSASGAERFDGAMAGLAQLASAGAVAMVDLMLTPQHVAIIAEELPRLRSLLPVGTPISLGVLFHGGREAGARLFGSHADLNRALDKIALEAGESIAANLPSPVAHRREGCSCALGEHLHVRSDGALFTCFKMEELVGDLARESFGLACRRVRSQPHPATALAACAGCAFVTLCGGGCRAENLQFTGDPDVPICGAWRASVIAELLAEDFPAALEWPATMQLAEAHLRGIPAPEQLLPLRPSRHLLE